jgi:hypothetical protein
LNKLVPLIAIAALVMIGHEVLARGDLLSGGCACGGAIAENRPNGVRSWTCGCEAADEPVHAWAVCIPVQVAADMKVPVRIGGR